MNDIQHATGKIESKLNNQNNASRDSVVTIPPRDNRIEISDKLRAVGEFLVRYGLVLVIGWIGAMKFTAYEANGIQPLVANSPILSWVYSIFSVQAFASAHFIDSE